MIDSMMLCPRYFQSSWKFARKWISIRFHIICDWFLVRVLFGPLHVVVFINNNLRVIIDSWFFPWEFGDILRICCRFCCYSCSGISELDHFILSLSHTFTHSNFYFYYYFHFHSHSHSLSYSHCHSFIPCLSLTPCLSRSLLVSLLLLVSPRSSLYSSHANSWFTVYQITPSHNYC